jgi:glycosyl transferase family 25
MKKEFFNTDLPPIWVVNLERSQDRRQFMQRQLETMGLDYRFIDAVDGKNLTEKDWQKYSKERALKEKRRELSVGEIGCALTHVSMYHQMIDKDIAEVLILEDDVFITEDLLYVLAQRRNFPQDWEVVNFANDSAKTIPLGEPIFAAYKICKFEGMANRTSTYLINLQGAKKLMAHLYPIRLPADDIIGRTKITGLNLYGITPQVVSLAKFKSEIWGNDLKVGLKAKVTGKLGEDGRFVAHEIRMGAAADRAEIEGVIERLDQQKNTLRLLKREFALPDGIAVKDVQRNPTSLKNLKAGDRVKLKGKYSEAEGFAPEGIKVQEATDVNLEELQDNIHRIDSENKTFEVAGFTVVFNEETTIF